MVFHVLLEVLIHAHSRSFSHPLRTITRFSLVICCPCIGLSCVLLAHANFSTRVAHAIMAAYLLAMIFVARVYIRMTCDQMRVVKKLHVHNKLSNTIEKIYEARDSRALEEEE